VSVRDISAFLAQKGGREVDDTPLSFGSHFFEGALSTLEQEQLMDLGHGSSSARGASLNDPQPNVDS
jgi:hypothetical protein